MNKREAAHGERRIRPYSKGTAESEAALKETDKVNDQWKNSNRFFVGGKE